MKIKKNVPATTTQPATPNAKKGAPKPTKPVEQAVAAKAAPEAKEPTRTGVNIGKTTGMRVMAFQDHTFARNDDPKFRRTDEEIAQDWRNEFPESRAVKTGRITADMVRAVRQLYN